MTNRELLRFLKDREGNIVILQKPNLAITGWAVCKIISLFLNNNELQSSLSYLTTAFLFTWAYLEITSGVNTFRQLLGLIVLCFVLMNIFS